MDINTVEGAIADALSRVLAESHGYRPFGAIEERLEELRDRRPRSVRIGRLGGQAHLDSDETEGHSLLRPYRVMMTERGWVLRCQLCGTIVVEPKALAGRGSEAYRLRKTEDLLRARVCNVHEPALPRWSLPMLPATCREPHANL